MKYIKNIQEFVTEVIKIPIKVGDTVLGGRFKNKKIVVKKIGKNDKGDITINGKPLLKFRIVKEGASYDKLEDDVDVYLAHLKDDGFEVNLGGSTMVGKPHVNNYFIRVWKSNNESKNYSYSNCEVFDFKSIEDELIRLVSIVSEEWVVDYIYVIDSNNERISINKRGEELVGVNWVKTGSPEYSNINKVKSFVLGLKKEVNNLDE